MNNYTITVSKFLDWYFNYGQDSENIQLRLELADLIINQLYKTGEAKITAEKIFDKCNQNAIRVNYLEEFIDTDIEGELSDVLVNYKVELI